MLSILVFGGDELAILGNSVIVVVKESQSASCSAI
jgi:hypothetical protein